MTRTNALDFVELVNRIICQRLEVASQFDPSLTAARWQIDMQFAHNDAELPPMSAESDGDATPAMENAAKCLAACALLITHGEERGDALAVLRGLKNLRAALDVYHTARGEYIDEPLTPKQVGDATFEIARDLDMFTSRLSGRPCGRPCQNIGHTAA